MVVEMQSTGTFTVDGVSGVKMALAGAMSNEQGVRAQAKVTDGEIVLVVVNGTNSTWSGVVSWLAI